MRFILAPIEYLVSLFLNGIPEVIIMGVCVFIVVAIVNIVLELL